MQARRRRSGSSTPRWPPSAPGATRRRRSTTSPRARHPQADDPLLVPVEGGAARGGGRPRRRRADRRARAGARPAARRVRPGRGDGAAVFRLAARRPGCSGCSARSTRLGPPASTRLLDRLEPLVARAARLPRGGDGRRPHAPPRPAPAAAGRLLDGHRHGDRGRGAARPRRAEPCLAVARPLAATSSLRRSCGPRIGHAERVGQRFGRRSRVRRSWRSRARRTSSSMSSA